MIPFLAALVHTIQGFTKNKKSELLFVEAVAKDAEGNEIERITAESFSSYYATAAFTGTIVELFIKNQIKPATGVLTLEDAFVDFTLLRDTIEKRKIVISN